MAIEAGHEVDVVLARFRQEGGIHLLDIQTAMRVGRMAGGAGPLGGVGVGGMAIQTAQTLMHAKGGAVILRTQLAKGIGSVALGAKPLGRICLLYTSPSPRDS